MHQKTLSNPIGSLKDIYGDGAAQFENWWIKIGSVDLQTNMAMKIMAGQPTPP